MLHTKEKYLDELDTKIKAREEKTARLTAELEEKQEAFERQSEKVLAEQKQSLLRAAHLTEDEARKEALKLVEQECEHEAAQLIQRKTEHAEADARENALKITLQAIQRYASEHTAASTTNSVSIPSDDMKGRVIGRGRAEHPGVRGGDGRGRDCR